MIQASTLNALMLGNFDRTISVKEFLHNANTGMEHTQDWMERRYLRMELPIRQLQTADVKVMSAGRWSAFWNSSRL